MEYWIALRICSASFYLSLSCAGARRNGCYLVPVWCHSKSPQRLIFEWCLLVHCVIKKCQNNLLILQVVRLALCSILESAIL